MGHFSMPTQIISPTNKVTNVKNLGWFFRKARKTPISEFSIYRFGHAQGWTMNVLFEDGYRFFSSYADLDVFEHVMGRQRSLKGVPVEVRDHMNHLDYSVTIGSPAKRG